MLHVLNSPDSFPQPILLSLFILPIIMGWRWSFLPLITFAALWQLQAPAEGRSLAQTQPNPFVASPDAASGRESLPGAAPTPETPPLLPPAPSPAFAPALEVAPPAASAATGSDPCACTTNGLSGGTNTSRIGCGQYEITSGSAAFSCFVMVRHAAAAAACCCCLLNGTSAALLRTCHARLHARLTCLTPTINHHYLPATSAALLSACRIHPAAHQSQAPR